MHDAAASRGRYLALSKARLSSFTVYSVNVRCVENVIRATESMSRLEARLSSAERERDEAMDQLKQLEQQLHHAQRAPVDPDMQRCSVLLQSQQLHDDEGTSLHAVASWPGGGHGTAIPRKF